MGKRINRICMFIHKEKLRYTGNVYISMSLLVNPVVASSKSLDV